MTRLSVRLVSVLDRVLDLLLFLVLAAMAAIVFANVFCRFVLQFSLSWADELAQVLMVWLTFLGAGVAMRDRLHYAFDYLVRSLPRGWRRRVRVVSHLLAITMTILLIYWSAKVSLRVTDWVMPATGMPRSWVYAACPVGCAFLLLYQIRNLLADVRVAGVPPQETAQVD